MTRLPHLLVLLWDRLLQKVQLQFPLKPILYRVPEMKLWFSKILRTNLDSSGGPILANWILAYTQRTSLVDTVRMMLLRGRHTVVFPVTYLQ
jgi:hypothetical protein